MLVRDFILSVISICEYQTCHHPYVKQSSTQILHPSQNIQLLTKSLLPRKYIELLKSIKIVYEQPKYLAKHNLFWKTILQYVRKIKEYRSGFFILFMVLGAMDSLYFFIVSSNLQNKKHLSEPGIKAVRS